MSLANTTQSIRLVTLEAHMLALFRVYTLTVRLIRKDYIGLGEYTPTKKDLNSSNIYVKCMMNRCFHAEPQCRRQGKDGYFRHHDLVKHLKTEHPLLSPGTILRNKNLDWYGRSGDKIASRHILCPHPDCATLTNLYRSGRFPNEETSEVVRHQRTVHNF
jgi:hypothetical protein